jgi:hypothetical protein
MVGKSQKSHGARSELNSVFSLETVDQWNPVRTIRHTVRSASLAKGRSSKKRPSPHLHKIPTRNNK